MEIDYFKRIVPRLSAGSAQDLDDGKGEIRQLDKTKTSIRIICPFSLRRKYAIPSRKINENQKSIHLYNHDSMEYLARPRNRDQHICNDIG
jgi:hypothetical protein